MFSPAINAGCAVGHWQGVMRYCRVLPVMSVSVTTPPDRSSFHHGVFVAPLIEVPLPSAERQETLAAWARIDEALRPGRKNDQYVDAEGPGAEPLRKLGIPAWVSSYPRRTSGAAYEKRYFWMSTPAALVRKNPGTHRLSRCHKPFSFIHPGKANRL